MTTVASRNQNEPAGLGRIPPHDLDAEMAVLGSMMLDRQAVEAVLPIIQRDEIDWFYRPDHRVLFQLVVDVYDRNEPIDLIVVLNELRRRGQVGQIGGEEYLVRLAESVPSWHNAAHYAAIVRDKGMLRDLIGCAGRIGEIAYADADEARLILDKAEEQLFAVTQQRVSGHAVALGDMLQVVYQKLESRDGGYLTGLSTGFHELDDLTSGLQLGDLIIVAARPSMGKTALGLNMAENMAMNDRNPLPVAFFSMEMSSQQIAQRILCSRGRVDAQRMRRGMLSHEDIQQLGYVCEQLAEAPMYIDDTPGMTALELRSKVRRFKRQYDIQAVFVDYLQLMHSPSHSESRQQEIAAISRSLKSLGRELNIPVIAMAQLNRQAESREGHRPRMSDLRESGAIEQDADVIMLLHREEYFKPQDESVKGKAEIIVAKQRNGPTATVELQFNHKLTRFANLSVSPTADAMGEYVDENTPF